MAKPQIFNRDMKRLAYLDNALAVGYGLETNSLWTATFTLPADDPKNAYCTPLNFVEIFDGDERIDLFRIIGEDMERSNGATRYYDCEHVLATLLSDVLFQYHQCGGSGVKTADVLNYILARQTRQNWKLPTNGSFHGFRKQSRMYPTIWRTATSAWQPQKSMILPGANSATGILN